LQDPADYFLKQQNNAERRTLNAKREALNAER